jgi:hypothetical protein
LIEVLKEIQLAFILPFMEQKQDLLNEISDNKNVKAGDPKKD